MKKITHIFTGVLLVLLTISANAQTFEWAKAFGGTSRDYAQSVAVDAQGNVYTVGRFEETVDFDPGVGIYNLTSNGLSDGFIQKLDASGNLVWAKAFGGAGSDGVESVAVDAQGNIYTVGYFNGTVDFDPGAGTHNLTLNGYYDGFIQKLDASGNFVWVRAFGGTGVDGAKSVAIDAQGNVYTAGNFEGTVDFDPGVGTHSLISNGYTDGFIQKLDALGNFVWAKSFGGTSYDVVGSVAIDTQGNVYTVGFFYGTADFDPGTGTSNLTSNGAEDCFIQKLDASGNLVWVKSFGGTGGDRVNSVAIDTQGNVYTVGNFKGTADFDPSVATYNLTSNGAEDCFIQKLDASGNFVWAKSFGGTGGDGASSVAIAPQGNVYTVGFFRNTADFDPGAGTYNLTSNGGDDAFIQKLDALGNLVWAKSFGGTDDDEVSSVAIDTEDNVYTAGNFEGTVDFNPGAGTYNLISNGYADGFVQKLSPCSANTGIDIKNECDSYTWIDGNTYTSSNNTATHTLTNIGGCDSVVTLNLTIEVMPTISITQNGLSLETTTGMDSYQWHLNNTAISGATNATHIATENGAYYCVVVQGACSQNSDVINISQVNINEIAFEGLKIYPNPAKDILYIEVQEKLEQIQLIDLNGKTVKNFNAESRKLDISTIAKGIYFIKLNNATKQSIQKVIIF